YTLLEISLLLQKTLGNLAENAINAMNQTTKSEYFMILWLNGAPISNYFQNVCTQQIEELVYEVDSSILIVGIVAACSIGVHIVLLILFYLPIFLYLSKKRNKILGLFLDITKEVIGGISQKLKKKNGDESYSKIFFTF